VDVHDAILTDFDVDMRVTTRSRCEILTLHRIIEISVATITVKRAPSGKWLVVFSCKDVPEHPLPKTGKTVGLDVGITHFVTDSDGHKIDNPKWYGKAEKSLRVLQRKLTRSEK